MSRCLSKRDRKTSQGAASYLNCCKSHTTSIFKVPSSVTGLPHAAQVAVSPSLEPPATRFSPAWPHVAQVQPLHVAAWIELQTQTLSAPTIKQRLAAIRHLFD